MDKRVLDPLALVQRIHVLCAELMHQNGQLRAEVDDLKDHIEGLSTKLTAAKAANHTLNQNPNTAIELQLNAVLDRDKQRIERLRALLEEYLGEIDRPIEAPPSNVNTSK